MMKTYEVTYLANDGYEYGAYVKAKDAHAAEKAFCSKFAGKYTHIYSVDQWSWEPLAEIGKRVYGI